jgi:gliding motility-associated lipoprotein GldD
MSSHLKLFVLALSAGTLLYSCRPSTPVPKPRGYFRIELPQHAYTVFDSATFPFRFEYPVYGRISQDLVLNKEEKSPYWLNVEFPDMNAAIYLSYKGITEAEPLDRLIEESFKLSYAHDIRADYIKTPPFKTANGLTGVSYNVGGNAASAYQFYITDNQKNFIRGALYFNVSPNADSLKPATEFLKKDMDHLIETIQFK